MAQPQDRPLAAILSFLLAMFVFVIMDAMAKHVARSMDAMLVIWLRYGLVLLLVLPYLAHQRRARLWRTERLGLHLLRGLCLLGTAVIFVLALQRLPLETATAMAFVSPLFVTMLSVPLLRERVGIRRWLAVLVGLGGVLAIVRPGGIAFEWALLIPLGSSLCWALSLILTRHMRGGGDAPFTFLLLSLVVGWILLAPFALLAWRAPAAEAWPYLGAIAVCHLLAQLLVIRAFTWAAASMLAPFAYSSIVWAVPIGLIFFDTLPDAPTVAGTLTLMAAGLYVWQRERALQRVPGPA